MPEQMFKIGDKVETDEKYKQGIEKLNNIVGSNAAVYHRGLITRVQTVTDYKHISRVVNGMYWQESTSEIENVWFCVTLDNDVNKQVNQIYLRLVEE